MGSRAADKLKEIEEVRSSLENKLGEFEERFPIAGFGKKAAMVLAGGSAGSTVLAFFMRRFRKRRTKKTSGAPPAGAPVVVNVVPKSVTAVAAAGIAVWAGVRLYEAMQRSKARKGDEAFRPAVVRDIPQGGRQTSAGS